MILLDEDEAAKILTKSESLVYANSDTALSKMKDILNGPFEIDVTDLIKDKSDFGPLLSEALNNSDLRDAETEWIQGEDITCDAYINIDGEPVVLGIYEHPVLDKNDFRDTVYYASSQVMRKMLARVKDALRKMSSSQSDFRNLPLHAKFGLQKGNFLLTMVNLRGFGSFSLSDQLFFAFGINPYK